MRKFVKIKDEFLKYGQKAEDIKMPVRATKYSVGYDFYSPIDYVLKPNETKLIFTNIKATFNGDEGLILAVTSGMGKRGVILANGIGIIECDYYSNPNNDGNLGFMLHNISEEDYEIKCGDKIGQGFFIKYYTVDDEEEITTIRTGGFGSTNK
jgi:dUTP pyrophosphatase